MIDETKPEESEIRKQNLLLAYQNPDNVTLYRYENPAAPYDPKREGERRHRPAGSALRR